MTLRLLFCILLLSLTSQLGAQVDHEETGNHHDHEGHHHHHNEFGIANALVYFVKEEAFSYGLHLHYIRTIGETKFGLGVGFERIFDEHGHNTFGVVGSYRPIDPLTFIISPGLTIEDASSGEASFALHLESAYEFEFKNIHLGPVIEIAYDPEDIHISIGIHLGYGF